MNKNLFRNFIVLAIPIIFQQLLAQSLVFIDQVMISGFKEEAIAGVGIANQITFFGIIVIFGVVSSGTIFISQYYGKKEYAMVQKIFGLTFVITILFSVILTILFISCAPYIFTMLFGDSNAANIGISYFQTTSLSFVALALIILFSSAYRAIERTIIPMIFSICAVVINIALNMYLIPKVGVVGSAIGTNIAHFVELFLFIGFFFIKSTPLRNIVFKFQNYVLTNKVIFKKFVKVATPVLIQEGLWAFATVLLATLYTQAPSNPQEASGAAASLASLTLSLETILFMGVTNACAIIIGKEIGENGVGKIMEISKKLFKYMLILNVITAVVSFFIGIPVMNHIFNGFEAETAKLVTYSMQVVVIMSTFKLCNWFMFIGFFRAGGDTKFSMYADVTFLYVYSIPAVLLAVFYFHMPIHFVLFIASFEEIIKLIIGIIRFESGKWIHDVTREPYHEEGESALI